MGWQWLLCAEQRAGANHFVASAANENDIVGLQDRVQARFNQFVKKTWVRRVSGIAVLGFGVYGLYGVRHLLSVGAS